jgi:6-phosphogluconolactonase
MFIFEKKRNMKKLRFITAISLIIAISVQAKTYNFIVGTFTKNTNSEGIYSVNFDTKSGKSIIKVIARNIENPAFLTISPDSNFIYSVSESGEASTINAFRFEKSKAILQPLNSVSAGGAGPCYIDASDKHVVTANYAGGSLVVFGRKNDGSLTEPIQIIPHKGSSIDLKRQTKPYVHQAIFSPCHQYVFTNDLGTDFMHAYHYNPNADKKILLPADSIKLKSGSGPRHLVFNKTGKVIYAVQELDGTVSVIGFENNKLKLIQETTLDLQKSFENAAADIHLSPDGKFLYVTNRGTAQNITCFKVLKNGTLKFIQQLPTGASWPRNFTLTADGKYIFIGNQHSNAITVFSRNVQSGKMKNTGFHIDIPSPVCIVEF